LSVLNVEGQARESSGRIVRERTKLLVVVGVRRVGASGQDPSEIVQAYNGRFGQPRRVLVRTSGLRRHLTFSRAGSTKR